MKAKKSLHPKSDSWATGWFRLCWGTIFERGHDTRLGGDHDGILRCGSRFMPSDSGMKTKISSLSQNLRLRHSVHPCFRPRTKVYLCLGRAEQAVFSGGGGGTGPKKHFSGTGPVHIFCLGGTSSDYVGKAPKCSPKAPGVGWALTTKSGLAWTKKW